VDAQYGKDTVETAVQVTEDMLTKNADLDGLFACNASTSVGALQGLRSQGRTEIKMIGFDTETALINGLKEGIIDSLVAQNPYKMGYEGVKAVIAKLEGQEVTRRINTGVHLVTQENLETPEIQALLR
jgi:ribose transport system substrate-binding protein